MTREEIITHEAIEAMIADTNKGRQRENYYINALADHEQGFKEGFIAGAQWADVHPHWISVDEQKPPVDEPLLLAVNGFGNAQFGQYYRDGIFRNLETYEYANKVTHWKLFPELPRGRE